MSKRYLEATNKKLEVVNGSNVRAKLYILCDQYYENRKSKGKNKANNVTVGMIFFCFAL